MSRLKHHTPKYQDAVGAFGLPYHLEMISDAERVKTCKNGIKNTINTNSVFLELGCGTGIFSIFAAMICKKVYAVDVDEKVLSIAKENAAIAGVLDKIEFIHSDVKDLKLNKKADIIFCEMMSIWLINEPQVPVINHARKELLNKNGVIIPRKIINLVELGNIDYNFEGIEIKASLTQFSGIRPPRIMTESRVFNSIDFSTEISKVVDSSCELKPLVPGIINCARISSIVELAEGVNFFSTDTLMPVTVVPLREQLHVTPDCEVIFTARYTHRSNIDDSVFTVKRK